MTNEVPHDDGHVRALLRNHAPAPPISDVDWDALHGRIAAGAAPLLRRRRHSWWQVLGTGDSTVQRAAAAAAIVALIAAGLLMPDRPATVTFEPEVRTIEEELAASVPYSSVPLLASGADDSDVIDALLLYDAEAR